ncbi:hypothetical protein B0H19DRAFT_1249419 [Mycena capillaripes]|nr:hypothetical protein B0H19DRAFT_1249419 [Mycena capillaripes]
MLLLLSLVYILPKSRGSTLGHLLDSRQDSDSCDDINICRTFFSIISGCLATVFACTGPHLAEILPDAHGRHRPRIDGGVCSQTVSGCSLVSKEYDVSLTHGFFFAMGGFVSRSGHHPIATMEQLEQYPEYLAAIRSAKARDIEDKSNGDAISKGVVLLQGLWFTAQCLARVHQHLPLTELEVATIAFQFVNIFIWLLWWHKPLDVQQSILIGSGDEYVAEVFPVIMGISLAFEPEISTSVPPFWSPVGLHLSTDLLSIAAGKLPTDLRAMITIEVLVGTVFGVIHCAAWNAHFPSSSELWMWRSCSLTVAAIPILLPVAFIFFWVTIPIYTSARLFLIVLPFTTLRGLPPGAFLDVDWSMYIPHVGL